MKICFLDGVKVPYNSNDIYTNKIRGAEIALINLSSEFSQLNHEVTIYNNCSSNIKIGNINWININNINYDHKYDLAITNNDIRLFDKIIAAKKIAISHSIQSIEKFIRKGQLFAFLKHKPKIVLLSNYHKKNRNIFMRFYGSYTTDWAIDKIFLNSELDVKINNDQAIFTSHVDRNLDLLIKIWKDHVFTINSSKRLLITPIKNDFSKYNIYNRKFGDKAELVSDILKSRMLLIPGHKAELFCISAEEARELCVPIITLGIGCLKERISHGKTGFIAKNNKEFSKFVLDIYKNENLWNELRKNLINKRGAYKWIDAAKEFISKI